MTKYVQASVPAMDAFAHFCKVIKDMMNHVNSLGDDGSAAKVNQIRSWMAALSLKALVGISS